MNEIDYGNLDLKECARSGDFSRNNANTQSLIMNLPVQTTRDEMLFITNMKRGWEVIIGCIDFPNDLAFMKELHKIIAENLVYRPGIIRTNDVIISGTDWRPGIPCEEKIINEISRINDIEDKIDSALEMFAFLARTQVFIDGNKRMAELMSNKILMQYEKGILTVNNKDINQLLNELITNYES